jgi:hypothetical protein
MSQQIERDLLFYFCRIEDEFLQKSCVGFDRWQHSLQSRWSAEQGRHLHGFDRRLQFLPSLPIVKSFPEIITIGKICKSAVERFLSAADPCFNLTKDRSGSDIGASVEEIASVSTRDVGSLIPGIK